MAFGDLTRQLAQQAIGKPVKDAIEALGKPAAQPAAAAAAADNVCTTILAQIQAMQKALKEDEELLVLFYAGTEAVRILEIFVPSWSVIVLTGVDAEKNVTRIVSPSSSIQLVSKIVKVQPGVKPTRVGLIVPKPKPE